MKKSPPTTLPQVQAYARERFSQCEQLIDEFYDIYRQVLHDSDMQRNADKVAQRSAEIKEIKASLARLETQKSSLSGFTHTTKKIEQILSNLKRVVKASADHYRSLGAREREVIQTQVTTTKRNYELYNTEWQPQIATALADNNYARAAQIVQALPKLETYPHIENWRKNSCTYEEFDELSRIHREINSWKAQVREAIPPKFTLTEEIKALEHEAKRWQTQLIEATTEYLRQTESTRTDIMRWDEYKFEKKQDELRGRIESRHRGLKNVILQIRWAKNDLAKLCEKSTATRTQE